MTNPNDLGPLPKEHDRAPILRSAIQEHGRFLTDLVKKHRLTSAEYYALLTAAMNEHAQALVAIERRKSP